MLIGAGQDEAPLAKSLWRRLGGEDPQTKARRLGAKPDVEGRGSHREAHLTGQLYPTTLSFVAMLLVPTEYSTNVAVRGYYRESMLTGS